MRGVGSCKLEEGDNVEIDGFFGFHNNLRFPMFAIIEVENELGSIETYKYF